MSHRPGDLPGDISNLIDLLRWRAARHPNKTAFTFLVDGEHEALELTYGELDRRARAIAARLQQVGAAAERAILLYPPGLEYIAAFFGCLYAGTIAVPAYPPRFNRNATRLQAIVADAQATIALTTAKTFTSAQQQFEKLPDLAELRWHSIDAEVSGEDAWREPARSAETLAFLQYTSGSTGTPKGVMLSHGNLLYNLSLIYESFEINAESVAVSWLPPYHDMGLIAGIMLPIYAGMPTILMSPAAFLQRPLRWLEAISRARATHSGGPNFAYELCVERSTPEQRAGLDLSSWTLGLNGAEPIRRETLDRFTEAFAPVGFRREVFYPAYGLAEASLIVAGGARSALPIVGAFDSQSLENNRVVAGTDETARVLVGCGTQLRGQEFRIVDPETSRECQPDQIGEIWVRGPSVAQGYWNQPETTEQFFRAHIAETGAGPFLRTGDLGFLNNGELFVTGRLKDLIIIRGRNHYPQDIEQTVARSHPALRLDYGAAFAVEVDGVEQLVVVQEIDRQQRHADLDAVISAIRRAVAEQHDLQVYSIALLKHGSIPKTSSGKIQRHACRSGLRDGTLDLVKLWTFGDEIAPPLAEPIVDRATPTDAHKTRTEIQTWLIAQLAERLKIPAQSIDMHEPFASYGLDSVAAIGIAGALEEWLDRSLPPTLVYDYPNIAALAGYLADEPAADDASLPIVTSGDEHEPIAIIGLGCRMPGAADPDAFWQLLHEGVDAIAEVPAERWDADALYDARAATAGKMNTRWGGFLDQVDRFDAQFFGVAPREAVQMDPQQRLLLEVAWEALENAGQIPEHLAGDPVGVFVGISASDYSRLHQRHASELDAYIGVGNALSIAANRLSYLLDFRGPSIAVDTACSSSLVALHLACQSLTRGESSMALAGGVNLILTPDLTIAFSQARMMSASGRCKTFAADADGYVRGEGCGVIVLKRLRDALRDNDPILAVVRGTAVNQDGRSNGLTAPNAHAQQAVIRQALADARLEPNAIGYVEAHGTGTPLGDPIEFQALSHVLHENRAADLPCFVGSVKTNIGHLEAAAGIAGVIKVVLALKHQEIPPHLHLTQLNPYIQPEHTPLVIATERQPWTRGDTPRIAGISSFGFGGTNAHVILEEAPAIAPVHAAEQPHDERPLHVLTLSAKSERSLQELARRYDAFLSGTAEPLADICYSANITRSHFARRLAVTGDTGETLRSALASFAAGQESVALVHGARSGSDRPKIAFLFTGQGSHYAGMAQQLYATQPTFRQTIDRCAAILDNLLDRPLLALLHTEDTALLDRTDYAQPVLFALEYALAEMWQAWGVRPDLVLGHSVGEYVAACVAGALSLEDGLALMVERGRLMSQTQPGAMAAIFAAPDRVRPLLEPYGEQIAIAAYNGPENTVISGEPAAVQAILDTLPDAGISFRALPVTQAFHSALLDPMLDAFEQAASRLTMGAPQIPLVSNLTGRLLEAGAVQNAGYWRRHAREAVHFGAGLQTLMEQGCTLFVEIGPGSALLSQGRRALPQLEAAWLPSLKQGADDWSILLHTLSVLYVQGVAVDWAAFDRGYVRRRVELPTYQFDRERYWIDTSATHSAAGALESAARAPLHPLLGYRLRSALPAIQFESQLSVGAPAFLDNHRVQGVAVLPATAYLMMALAAAEAAFGAGAYELADVTFHEALFLPDAGSRTAQIVLTRQAGDATRFEILSLPAESAQRATEWTQHVTGTIRHNTELADPTIASFDLDEIRARCQESIAGAAHYGQLHDRGLHYGTAFQGVVEIARRDGEALGRMQLPASLRPEVDAYPVHPALLDACLQVLADTPTQAVRGAGQDTYLPIGLQALRIYRHPEAQLWSYAVLRSDTDADADSFSGDVLLLDESGAVVVEAQGLRLQSLSRATRRTPDRLSDWLYQLTWQPQTIEPTTNPAPIERERWLILADQRGVGQHIASLLAERGIDCVSVSADQIDAANPAAFTQLLADLSCRRIVHLWSLDAPSTETLTEAELEWVQLLGSGSVVAMMQALAAKSWNEPPQIWIVTEGAQPLVSGALAVAQAPVWGLGRSIALEQPEHWGGLIDLEAGVVPDFEALITEVANTTGENQIAWRGGQRYVARLARVEAAPTQPQPILLHAAGTYLITGGLGSLGLQVARWMVEQGARRLVLLGRSALPDRASWDDLPHDHPASDQIAALHELERLGATMVVARADVADQSQMQALFAELQRTLPPIRGIVHAAGVAQPTPLAALDAATLTAVLRPKVAGAWLLHQLSRQLPLDFFVCFSSIAAVWGSRELAHYAAANQFLDALAHLRRAQGLTALSINWGPWAEHGMAATAERNRALKLTGLNPLPAEQALTALSYGMQSSAAQQIVVDADWTTFTALYGVKSSARFFEQIGDRAPTQLSQVVASSGQRDLLLSLPPTERRAQLLDDLRRQVAGVLRLEPQRLDVEQPLNTLGLDSLMAVELKNGIEASLRVSLPMVTFLQGPSIAQLTDEILDRVGDSAPVAASAPPKLVAAHDASPEQPLSLGQRALWFLHQLAPDSTAYNIVGASKIRSVVDLDALRRVFQRLVDRHPSLRTTFTAPSGTPIQVIHQRMDAFFQAEDASAWTEAELNTRLVEEAHRSFDLEAGPLFRAYLFTRSSEEHVLLLAVHHTIADFWSLVVLINEVGVLYPAEIAGTGAALVPLDVTYADYARWQAEMLRGAEGARLWSYWSEQLAGDLPFLNLPTDKPRPAVQTYRGASQTLTIDAALTQQLKAVCEDHRTTLYTALMAAWHALLHRYTGQSDILVGSPIAGRNWAEVAGVVGYFVSPVVIRGSFADNPSFGALLDQMRQTVLDALEHHQYPLALLAERLKPVRDPSRSPLFQAMFILQKAQLLNDQGLTPFVLRETGAQMDLGGLTLESLALEQRVAQFDLTLVMVEANGSLAASLEYNTDLFEAATIERMLGHFKTLLAAMVAQPWQPITTLPLLTEHERRYLLADLNATMLSYPRTQRLHELFEAQAARTPEAIAVVFADQQLTYAELDRRANQLAHHVQSRGVGPDRLVGVCVERSPEMVIALLAVLKAGGAYVPLDPNYPSERIRYVLEDSRAALLLTQASLLEGLQITDYRHEIQVLCLDRDWPTIAQASQQPPVCAANTEDLAYVIYTSGSLGRPKGVQIPHRAVVNFLSAMQREPGLAAHDTLLSVTTLSFDIAGLEIFLPLSVGARLIVASREIAADGQRLIRLLDETATTVMQATPATWRLLIESGWQGNPHLRILCGGEALPQDLAGALIARSAALWNMYGPTETTIWSLAQQIDAEQPRITIGRPIANTQIYLLDATLQPVPIGVHGQICIGGDGLARGYLNRPALTAEKFIPDPFSHTPGSRLYQTGDLARSLPDGSLEFLGRIDHQVKVRGYRIELGEIEAVLRQQPAVRDAVVVAREVAGDTRLVAYVVGENQEPRTKNLGVEQKNKEQRNKEQSTVESPSPVATGEGVASAGGEGLTSSSLRAALRAQLPEYMIPSAIMVLDALPQTPNGKIDRKALPSPEGVRSELETYVAPQTELETTIAAIWQELLGLERVGVHDNFFDLGGHSLLTAQVHSRLRSTLGREISIVDLFKYPTIAALAQYLGQNQPAQPTFEQTLERVAAYRSAIRSEHATTDIAIVGMAGRFPGAANVEEFWRNISAGVESLKRFTDEELLAAGVDPTLLDHPQYVKVGPALDGIELFDATFFGYNPREAALLDPQQRLFLTSAYEALEHAGYDSQQYSGAIGVYAGAGMNTYLINNLLTNRQLAESVSDFQTMISNDKDFLTTRVSYLLNLRGPSVNVQSACSTSLVAVTLACQSLLNHQSDLALAGGVSLRVPQTGYLYQEEGIRSPDGHCRAFDASAQGTIFGSGVGVVVLKRLDDALTDGDTIHAVIKGAAINNDGSGKIGYTAPSVDGQAQVIAEALAVAGVDPATIDYVEAHGTGTALGDPIEIAALTEAFRATTDASGYCAIGSVKTNVGHLDTAAGVAGLIKTVLALKHRQLPPSLHFERPNPQIDFASSPFYVNSQLSAWPERERPRRAGVSALGIGGTNAHVIVEESPASAESDSGRPWQILLLSAKTATALETATTNLAEHLRQHPEQNLADVAYTLQLGRRSFDHRRVLVCRDRDEAIQALESRDPQRVVTHVQEPGARNIAFMFPGGGAQYVNMAAELYAHEPVFKTTIERCAELLRSHIDAGLREFLYPVAPTPEATRRLEQPSLALPALFATEYALAQLWQSWGVKPTAMIGHSLGEYVAACLAGVISLADALALVTLRGQLFEQLPPGAMLSVPLPESDLLPLLGSDLSLAAVNGPTLSVVSGPIAAIEALAETLAARGIETNRLHIDVAAHSAMLEPILEPFAAFVRTITLSPPQTRFISNVTGTWITDAQATNPEYWVKHLRQTVYFGAGVGELLNPQNPQSSEILLEVGPGHTLSALVRQSGHDLTGRVIVSSLRRPTEQQPDLAFLLNTLGQLVLAGVPIDWSEFYRGQQRRRLPLPTYPFEPQRYWIDPQPIAAPESAQPSLDKKQHLADWGYLPIWKQAPLPTPKIDAEPTIVLLFAHIGELSAGLIERLEQAGHQVVKVRTGNFFRQHNDRSYTLNPREPEQYEALIQALGDQSISKIVHAWSVTPDDVENLDRPGLGFYSLLFLAQALGKHAPNTPVELSVLTNSAHEITGGDGSQPEQATVLGPVKVIPQEYSQISCRSVDLVLPKAERHKRQLFDLLVAELIAPATDTLVAYRGNQRWTQDFAPLPIASSSTTPTRLRENGVYLLTGGLGAIGLVLAEYLARTVRARLVLVGRSEFPARAAWPELIAAADEHDATRRRIEQVQALEALGAEVLILSADVADPRQMQPVLDQTIERFGTLHGVIHAAGVPAGGMIQTKTAESAAGVLAPKVQGTQVLAKLLRDQPLDFIVLCSSISAVVGAFGQIDHCAANAFLDAWARHHAAHSDTPIIAINWPAWQDVGQAANAAIPAELLAWRSEQLKQGIVAAEGAELFGRILELDTPQVIVSPQDLAAVIEQNRSLNAASYLAALEAGQIATPSHPRPLLRTAYVAPRNEIEQTVAEIWQQLLGIEQIGVHDNFFDLGGHSLLATQIVSRIRERFQVELSLRQLLETPTIADVALAIVQQQGVQAGDDLLAQMLMELEELSDDDARDLLDFEAPVAE